MTDSDGLPGAAGGAPPCRVVEGDDTVARFSNYAATSVGAAHTIAAPGTCITSDLLGGGTAVLSGTSMATPHVAGSVALCLGSDASPGPCAGMTPAEIIDAHARRRRRARDRGRRPSASSAISRRRPSGASTARWCGTDGCPRRLRRPPRIRRRRPGPGRSDGAGGPYGAGA